MQQNNKTAIEQRLVGYVDQLESHPIGALCSLNMVPRNVLALFAEAQLGDSNTWLGMLATAKGIITEPKLLEAVKANIACEAGLNGVPHPTLCAKFAAGLGVTQFRSNPKYFALQDYTIEASASAVVMTENKLAGWLLAQESLVPILFRVFRSAFAKIKGIDLTYLDEHIRVDTEEHARWMLDGVLALLEKSKAYYGAKLEPDHDARYGGWGTTILGEVLYGIDLAGRVTLSVPDILYGMTLRHYRGTAPWNGCPDVINRRFLVNSFATPLRETSRRARGGGALGCSTSGTQGYHGAKL